MVNSIQWLSELDAGKQTAQKENKPILLDFFNPN